MKRLIILAVLVMLVVGCSGEAEPVGTPVPINTPEPTPTCSERDGGKYVEQLSDIVMEWDDATSIAHSTGRGNLPGPVGELQRIRRETLKIEVPECAESAQVSLAVYMEFTIDGFLAFMRQESDSAVDSEFENASISFDLYIEEMDKILGE